MLWHSLPSLKEKPSPRTGHSLVYIPARDQSEVYPLDPSLVIFAGASLEEGFRNDLWTYDFKKQKFIQTKSGSTSPPPPRYEHFSCYLPPLSIRSSKTFQKSEQPISRLDSAIEIPVNDTTRPRVLFFGGSGFDGCLNDIWTWDCLLHQFTNQTTSGSLPSPRTCHFSCCLMTQRHSSTDATRARSRQELIVWGGGLTGAGPIEDNAVYVLDIESMVWSQHMSSASGRQPQIRLGHTLTAIDDSHALLFGGMSGDVIYNDVWILDINSFTWEQIQISSNSAASPSLSGHISVYIPSEKPQSNESEIGGQLIVHGGMKQDMSISSDIRVFDLASKSWYCQPSSTIPIDIASAPQSESLPFKRLNHAAVIIPKSVVPSLTSKPSASDASQTSSIAQLLPLSINVPVTLPINLPLPIKLTEISEEVKDQLYKGLEMLGLNELVSPTLEASSASSSAAEAEKGSEHKADIMVNVEKDIDAFLAIPNQQSNNGLTVSSPVVGESNGDNDIDAMIRIGQNLETNCDSGVESMATYSESVVEQEDDEEGENVPKASEGQMDEKLNITEQGIHGIREEQVIIFFGGMDLEGMYQDSHVLDVAGL
ncbi:hypothetical protein BKA69DRAFT_1125414 [Paraphysoderma sedebokerense]|nr:hypothetical protein BKA69DRAFT_1125414 [Paraphysoderma sedebokerense]